MRKTLIAATIAGAFALPSVALAQAAAPAAAASPHTVTGNLSLVTDYRFRGITQTFGQPALQGGIDYSHASGIYLGNWNSNVSQTAGFPDGNLEMDFYGGYKFEVAKDLLLDLGVMYYYYPGSDTRNGTNFYTPANLRKAAPNAFTGSTIFNTEVYLGATYKFITAKYSHAVSDYFKVPSTKSSSYFDLAANYDLGDGWGINGHIGRLSVKNFGDASYTDYKLGVTKDVGGWVFGASYISTNAKDNCSPTAPAFQVYCFTKNNGVAGSPTYAGGKDTVVVSVTKSF